MWTSYLHKKKEEKYITWIATEEQLTSEKTEEVRIETLSHSYSDKGWLVQAFCLLFKIKFIWSDIHACCGKYPLQIFVSLIKWVACLIKTSQKNPRKFPCASDKGVTLPTLAATLHQVEISSELTKLAEPGLIGREMARFQQLPGAAGFSSD